MKGALRDLNILKNYLFRFYRHAYFKLFAFVRENIFQGIVNGTYNETRTYLFVETYMSEIEFYGVSYWHGLVPYMFFNEGNKLEIYTYVRTK